MQESGEDPRASEAWLTVCDDLIGGFNHELSNRIAAIGSLTRLLEDDSDDDPLIGAITSEVETLERTLGLLRLIPRSHDIGPEPERLEDLLPGVLALHRLRSDRKELVYRVEKPAEARAVLIDRGRLTHAILLLLDVVSRAGFDRGGEVVLRIGGDDDVVTVTIDRAAAERDADYGVGTMEENSGSARDPALVVRIAGGLLRSAGGELAEGERAGESNDYPTRFMIELPTLLALRRGNVR